MTKVVAFTGGLDSTWALQKIIETCVNDHESDIRVAYFSMWQGAESAFVETVFGRAILQQFRKTMPAHFNLRYDFLTEGNFNSVVSTPHHYRLVQQGNVTLGLASIMNRVLTRESGAQAVVGWNKYDCADYNLSRNDWYEQDYERLRKMYESLIYFQDHGTRVSPLLVPAWNMEKLDMFMELPVAVQMLLQIGNTPTLKIMHDTEDKCVYVRLSTDSPKYRLYRKLGLSLPVAWRIEVDEGFYHAIQATDGRVSWGFGSIPDTLTSDPEFMKGKGYHETIKVDEPQLNITHYYADRWDEMKEGIDERLKQQEQSRREARRLQREKDKALDAPTSEVASSRSEGDSGNQHNGEVRAETSGTDVGLSERVSEVGQRAASAD